MVGNKLLIFGMAVGLCAAFIAVLNPNWDGDENQDLVAVVNGKAISEDKFLSHLQSLASDKKDALEAADREYILQRIIEEELLVQRGLEVGLLDSDKRSRAAVVNAMIGMATADAEATLPSEKDLVNFYQDNTAYFVPSARLRVRQLLFKNQDQAQEAYQRLQKGEAFGLVGQELGVKPVLQIPDSLLPPAKLREYIGPSALAQLQKQPVGFLTPPHAVGQYFRLLVIVGVHDAPAPALDAIHAQVEAEYRRRQGDEALRDYLQWLKSRADIERRPDLPVMKGPASGRVQS